MLRTRWTLVLLGWLALILVSVINDTLYGDSTANLLIGGDDVILGGLGDDKIDGMFGTDTCYSGGGNDTFSNCESIIR